MSKLAKSETAPESCWRTPGWLVKRIEQQVFDGAIGLDPCSDLSNPTDALRFYAPPNDGILLPWDAANIYINPPYGRTIALWVEKALLAAQRGSKVVLLVPARPGGKWAQSLLQEATDILFMAGRISFVDPQTGLGLGPAKFPSMLAGLNISLKPLSQFGTLLQVKR